MRSEDLSVFQAVVDAGNVTAAADRLGRSQPTLSRQLQRLEADLGTSLLERHPQGMRLTPAGERVAEFARERLAAEEALRAELREGGAQLHGVVRIIASTTPGDYLVPQLVARFAELHPAVRVEVEVGDSAAVPGAVLDRRADVGFAGRANPDERLTHTPVARDEIVLAVPAGHPLASYGAVSLSALEGERLIWREDGSGTQRTFMEALAQAGCELPAGSSTASLGSTQAVVSAVQAGLGIGVVSHRAIADHPAEQVAAVRIAGIPIRRHLWMVYETGRPRPGPQAAFITFVAGVVAGGGGDVDRWRSPAERL
jgi:DNA-binding transcriptional LysR family regulator